MRAVIFDLDGTLWDATEALTAVWQRELKRIGIDRVLTRSHMVGGMGLGPEALAQHMAPELPPKEREPFFSHVTQVETDFILEYGAKLYPGLEESLRCLKKDYALMIASNCVDGYIEAFLRYSGLEALFCDFLHPGITGLPKADNIRLLMERNGIREAVLVGDTPLDEEAAQGAGVPFIHAAYGFGKSESAKWHIDALTELPDLLPNIFE